MAIGLLVKYTILLPWFMLLAYANTKTSISEHLKYPTLPVYGSYKEIIAKGATGDVVRFQQGNSTSYAIKVFVKNTIPDYDREYNRSIKEEYDIARKLKHPSLVETYDLIFNSDFHQWCMIMQYCPSVLSQRIRAAFDTNKLTSDRVADDNISTQSQTERSNDRMSFWCIFHQLLHGITYMHDRGIAHADLKPNNIGIDENGQVRILDFGISYQAIDALTAGHRLLWGPRGGIPYVSPEVYLETFYDPMPVDIFALAVLFCEMMEPRLPWKRRAFPNWERDTFSLFAHDAVERHHRYHHEKNEPSNSRQLVTLTNKSASVIARGDSDDLRGSRISPTPGTIQNDTVHHDGERLHDQGPRFAYSQWELDTLRATMDSLVTLLPHESRGIIRRMLEPDPDMRAKWEEIWTDQWVRSLEDACG